MAMTVKFIAVLGELVLPYVLEHMAGDAALNEGLTILAAPWRRDGAGEP